MQKKDVVSFFQEDKVWIQDFFETLCLTGGPTLKFMDFHDGMSTCGVGLNKEKAKIVYDFIHRSATGNITIHEFTTFLRPWMIAQPLVPIKSLLVRAVEAVIDVRPKQKHTFFFFSIVKIYKMQNWNPSQMTFYFGNLQQVTY